MVYELILQIHYFFPILNLAADMYAAHRKSCRHMKNKSKALFALITRSFAFIRGQLLLFFPTTGKLYMKRRSHVFRC